MEVEEDLVTGEDVVASEEEEVRRGGGGALLSVNIVTRRDILYINHNCQLCEIL